VRSSMIFLKIVSLNWLGGAEQVLFVRCKGRLFFPQRKNCVIGKYPFLYCLGDFMPMFHEWHYYNSNNFFFFFGYSFTVNFFCWLMYQSHWFRYSLYSSIFFRICFLMYRIVQMLWFWKIAILILKWFF